MRELLGGSSSPNLVAEAADISRFRVSQPGPAEGERRGRITQAWKRQGREAALRETGVEAVGFHPLGLEGGRHQRFQQQKQHVWDLQP